MHTTTCVFLLRLALAPFLAFQEAEVPPHSIADVPEKVVFYDVDFAVPPHALGAIPVVDDGPLPRRGPSRAAGAVVQGPKGLPGTVCLFDRLGLLEFHDLGNHARYGFEVDLLISHIAFTPPGRNSLRVFLDTPRVQTVNFHSLGLVRTHASGALTPPEAQSVLGIYKFGQRLRLQIELDLEEPRWDIWINGCLVHSAGLDPSEVVELRRVRVSFSSPLDLPGIVYVDNVHLYGHGEPVAR